jgi:hypothetical protein
MASTPPILRRRRVAPIGIVDGALVLATAASESDDEAVGAIAWAVGMPVVPRLWAARSSRRPRRR